MNAYTAKAIRTLKTVSLLATIAALLVAFQNCGPQMRLNLADKDSDGGAGAAARIPAATPAPTPPPAAPLVPKVTLTGNNALNCSQNNSSITISAVGFGADAKGCIEYTLTTPARLGETHFCNTSTDFAPLATPELNWSYNAVTDTWAPTVATTLLKGSNAFMPGTWVIVILGSDGETVVRSQPVVIATSGTNPNTCNP